MIGMTPMDRCLDEVAEMMRTRRVAQSLLLFGFDPNDPRVPPHVRSEMIQIQTEERPDAFHRPRT